MANNGNSQALAVIVGDRMRQFREERGLRQADIAAAASAAGLLWSRSSVAALESGSRNLSVEELLLLPYVISNAGGWDKPLLNKDDKVRISRKTHVQAEAIAELIAMLLIPIGTSPMTKLFDPEGEDISWGPPEPDGRISQLDEWREKATASSWRLAFSELYPAIDFDEAIAESRVDYELAVKMADRLDFPGEDSMLPWYVPALYCFVLWGATPGWIRDDRAGDPESYASKRSLQSARGHVTRLLIAEIQHRINLDFPVVRGHLDGAHRIWDDMDKLFRWQVDTFGQARRNRESEESANPPVKGEPVTRRSRQKS